MLRVPAPASAAPVERVRLAADGVVVDYPVQASAWRGVPTLIARIALDAPILDRMLVARDFTVLVTGRSLRTGEPGAALARVVRLCREAHWPRVAATGLRPARSSLRPASMDPSEAGFAKK